MPKARFVYATWHGGGNYAVGDIAEHTEVFRSLKEARHAFSERAHVGGHWRQRFDFADGRTEHVYTPTVSADTPEDGGPSMFLYYSDPREAADPYPDREISFGPRGGVRDTPC